MTTRLGEHENEVRKFLDNGKPGEALVYLARVLDETAPNPSSDPWAVAPAVAPLRVVEDEWTEETGRKAYELALEKLGDDPGGEDTAAWQAKRQLARDLLQAPTSNVGVLVPASSIKSSSSTDELTIDIPLPLPAQVTAREKIIATLKLDQENWHKPEIPPCDKQYLEGGPLWMYLAHRDYCTGLPRNIVQLMVEDLQYDNPAEAMNMGLDLLKRDDTGNSGLELAKENLIRTSIGGD